MPAQISVIKHRGTKYACRHCKNTTTNSKIINASKPKHLIPSSTASPEALAAVVTSKDCDALPLNQQTDILKRVGFDISRSTFANWCIKASALVKPIIDLYRHHLPSCVLRSHIETPHRHNHTQFIKLKKISKPSPPHRNCPQKLAKPKSEVLTLNKLTLSRNMHGLMRY